MLVDVREEEISALARQAQIPIAFRVDRILWVTPAAGNAGGFLREERAVASPYVKDYDAIPNNGPASWQHQFDTSQWGFLTAQVDGELVGGVVVARQTPGLDLLDNRMDLAVLWDVRVHPNWRGQGVGTALFKAAERWAAVRGYRRLRVETQNINVPACRFYERQGCELESVDPMAYPDFPEEVQLIWHKPLSAGDSSDASLPRNDTCFSRPSE